MYNLEAMNITQLEAHLDTNLRYLAAGCTKQGTARWQQVVTAIAILEMELTERRYIRTLQGA